MIKLTQRDKARLKGVHPDLVRVVEKYLEIGSVPILIIEGVRTLATQKKYLAKGATTTLRSRHLTGHAIDIGPRDTPLSHWPPYYAIAKDFKKAAQLVGVSVEWGGDWKSFKDGPHWQLPWRIYPAGQTSKTVHSLAMNPDTEGASAVRKASMFGVSGVSGGGLAIGDTFDAVLQSFQTQQYELTSGETVRVVIGLAILAMSIAGLYYSWKSYKDSQEAPEVG